VLYVKENWSRRGKAMASRLWRIVPVACAVPALAMTGQATAATDGLTAMNVVPPGESGSTTLLGFAAGTAGGSFGPNIDNQESLYANWQYKPLQFEGEGQGTAPPGDPNVLIWRDPTYGVPTITGKTDVDTMYGMGYAMAQDRLFQMEVFRHVGSGTLASLVGPSGLAMDEEVRRYTEGPAALQAEFNALPAEEQQRLEMFVDGINAYIAQVGSNPLLLPAEFTLLGDTPVKPFTILDLLGFGEYAARFFAEFGHGEMGALQTYVDLVHRYGIKQAETIFDDLIPLNDPHAPTSIPASEGRFPKHVSAPVPTKFRGSSWANHAPQYLPSPAQAGALASQIDARQDLVVRLIRQLALPRWGSNAAIVSGKLTTDHKPMLYGGPQTGWSVPGFFWEAELHSPERDERGVTVPLLPFIAIGRNSTAAWTVTSALDGNEDTYELQLNNANTSYVHDHKTVPVTKTTETIPCRNPPSSYTSLLKGSLPTQCPSPPVTLTVYHTPYGPSIADPDAAHQLLVRDSALNGHLLSSFENWDLAGEQTTATTFAKALKGIAFGFNFFYIDDHGTIGYWHVGRYPIEAANADPRLPLPGTGAYDWKGFEPFSALPHVINPADGYVANWNNKPAVDWYSKPEQLGGEGGVWGDAWEVQPLQHAIVAGAPFTLQSFGQLPRAVAYVDNAARVLLPYLRKALTHTTNPQLVAIRPYLNSWNGLRNDVTPDGKTYSTPAVVFFDRFVEMLMRDTEQPVLGNDWVANAGLTCATCHLVSVDNLTAPTYKFESFGEQLLLSALDGHAKYRWIPNPTKALLQAATDTANELGSSQGTDPSQWNEPVEQTTFTAQGAISAPAITPLMNRGSYGQVIEATSAPARG
jgi:penicillin amidase